MEQDIAQVILAKLDNLEQGQAKLEQKLDQGLADLKEELLKQGHQLSLQMQGQSHKYDEKLDSVDDLHVLFDAHEPRLVKLEDTVDTLTKDMDTLKAAAN